MSDKGSTPIAAAGRDQPFLLLGGCSSGEIAAGEFSPALRRMGLQPEPCDPGCAAADLFSGAVVQVRYAEQRALIGLPTDALLAGQGPVLPEIDPYSILACAPTETAIADRVLDSRELFKLAVLLIDLFGAETVFWSPAGLWSDASQFRAAIAEMLVSGMPPVLHLVAFRPHAATSALHSQGLAHFAGQELQLRDGGGLEHKELVRRLARLAIDIMVNGPLRAPRDFAGMSGGERIRIEPGAGDDAATLYVSIGFA